MSRDAEAKSTRLFDRRTVERNIKKGLITRKDYEKHLKTLDDVTDKGMHGSDVDTEAQPAAASESAPAAAAADSGSNSHHS